MEGRSGATSPDSSRWSRHRVGENHRCRGRQLFFAAYRGLASAVRVGDTYLVRCDTDFDASQPVDFVGRRAEREMVDRLLAEVQMGHGGVLVVRRSRHCPPQSVFVDGRVTPVARPVGVRSEHGDTNMPEIMVRSSPVMC